MGKRSAVTITVEKMKLWIGMFHDFRLTRTLTGEFYWCSEGIKGPVDKLALEWSGAPDYEQRIIRAVEEKRAVGQTAIDSCNLLAALKKAFSEQGSSRGDAEGAEKPKALKAGDVWTCPETGLSYDVRKPDGANISCEVCSFADDMNCPLTPEGLCLCLYDQPEKEHEIYFVERTFPQGIPLPDEKKTAELPPEEGTLNAQRSTLNAQRSTLNVEGGYQLVALALIDASPYQPGTARGDPERDPEVLEIAQSIRENGLVEPMILRAKEGGRFELIAGHRRLSACRLAGLEAAACVVRDADDAAAQRLHFLENLQRKDLTAIEEAQEVAAMRDAGWSHEAIAGFSGKSVRWVYRREAIVRLDPAWQGAAGCLKLSAAFLERVGRLPLKIQAGVYASMGVAAEIEGSEAFADVDFQRGGDCGELDKHIKAQLREIGKAPWAVNGAAPECDGCADRTDAVGDGGEEYEGAPRCLKAACWDKMLDAHVADTRKALKKDHAQVIEAPGRNASLYSPTRSQKMSVPVLVTDGPRKGETLWAPGKDDEAGEPEKAKGPGIKDKERFAYVAAVRACLESAAKPEWPDGEGEPVQVPHAALVAFACGCGVSSYALVSGAYSGALPRSLAILDVLSKAGSMEAERAALWLAAKPAVLKALDLDERAFNAAAWETMEALALKLKDAFRIPPGMVNGFYTEFAPKGKKAKK